MYKLSVYVQAYILIKILKNLPKVLLYFFLSIDQDYATPYFHIL